MNNDDFINELTDKIRNLDNDYTEEINNKISKEEMKIIIKNTIDNLAKKKMLIGIKEIL